MAKRLIDTDIFKKAFVKGLDAPYKLLWLYIINDCNHAGIYEVELDVAILRIGCPEINSEDAINFFGDKIVVLDGGTKWFIPSFISFQYGQLAENNRAHTGAISILKKYGLLDENLKIKEAPCKPLAAPQNGAMDMVKDKEQEMDKEKEKGKLELRKWTLDYPFDSMEFLKLWNQWKEYKSKEFKFNYKSHQSEQAALMELANLSNSNEHIATAIIMQSMAKGWKGFFKLDTGNGKQQSNHQDELDQLRIDATAIVRDTPRN